MEGAFKPGAPLPLQCRIHSLIQTDNFLRFRSQLLIKVCNLAFKAGYLVFTVGKAAFRLGTQLGKIFHFVPGGFHRPKQVICVHIFTKGTKFA